MKNAKLFAAACLLILAWSSTSVRAGAATISKSEARNRVSLMKKDQEKLLQQIPGLGEIDEVIRNDCATKVQGHSPTDEFCTCGAAVTMSLWRSGVDPDMVPRLQDFLNGTGTLKAADFIQYEGPELYRPLCELASSS